MTAQNSTLLQEREAMARKLAQNEARTSSCIALVTALAQTKHRRELADAAPVMLEEKHKAEEAGRQQG